MTALDKYKEPFYNTEGSTIKNPIYVRSYSDIPSTFRWSYANYNDGEKYSFNFPVTSNNSHFPAGDRFPDIPSRIVIGAEDLRKLFPGEVIDSGMLAYFEIDTIVATFSQAFFDMISAENIQENFLQQSPQQIQSTFIYLLNLFPTYYFIGSIKAANFCSGRPDFQLYTQNSNKSLEINLLGNNLELTTRVLFTYPNGVVKEAEILKGGLSDDSAYSDSVTIVRKEDIWRDRRWRPEQKETNLDRIKRERSVTEEEKRRRIEELRQGLENIDPDGSLFPGKELLAIKTEAKYKTFLNYGAEFVFAEDIQNDVVALRDIVQGAFYGTLATTTLVGAGVGSVVAPALGTVLGAAFGAVVGGVAAVVVGTITAVVALSQDGYEPYRDQYGNEYYINVKANKGEEK